MDMAGEIPVLSKEEVLRHINEGTAAVVNVLARRSYDELHIRGSVSVPFDLLEEGKLDAIGTHRRIITYCKDYTCGASMGAARILRDMGYESMVYEGGIKEWKESGFPVEGTESGR